MAGPVVPIKDSVAAFLFEVGKFQIGFYLGSSTKVYAQPKRPPTPLPVEILPVKAPKPDHFPVVSLGVAMSILSVVGRAPVKSSGDRRRRGR